MANRIIAVDLGAWSLKVAIAQPGLRHATLTGYVERRIPPATGDGSDDDRYEARAGRVLSQLIHDLKIDHDNVYLGVPGDHVFTHVLEFPFKSLRRADLERAVGAELENVVPVDLEDMVYAFETLPTDAAAPAAAPPGAAAFEAPTRGRVAAPAEGMRVLTYAMALDKARAWLEIADEAGAEAHSLIPEAGPMARLVERLPSLAAVRAQGPIVVIDLGHARTDVVVVHGGRAIYARALARAGKHLTEAVARQWRLGWPEAEQAKHTDGFVASTAMPATSKAWARVSEVMTAELNPLARELRQTLAACRAKTGAVPAGALLVGGGSRLRGLPTWLGEQLGLPIVTIADGDAALLTGPKLAGQVGVEGGALALGMVIDAEAARPLLDLRQGPLAHEVDLTFLRTKAVALSAAVVAITAAATISAWVHHAALRKAQRVLDERLAIESTEEFGDPKTADEILSSASGQVAGAVSPLPKMTAWDTLLDISNRMPAHDKITLDVDTIDIDPSKILFKGTAMTPDEVDAIEAALKAQVPNEQPCYVEVNRGATQQVGDKRQFEFTIKPACM